LPDTASLAQVLFTQGFGTRRACQGLIRLGDVAIHGSVITDPEHRCVTQGLQFTVQGQPWLYREKAHLMLHKPAGYECSMRPKSHPGVLTLLPAPLRQRGVQPVGRLDQDTTGLLLLTDDGRWQHQLISPKRHIPKVYEARTHDPVTPAQLQALLDGVVLHDDPQPVCAQAAERLDEHTLQLTLTQGKYHQVKRMVAAVGNHVTALHRTHFGSLRLPNDLAPGQWCWVEPGQVTSTGPSGE